MEHSLGVYRLGLKPAALEDARELFLTASATLIEGAQQIVEDLNNPLLGFFFSLAPLLHLVTVLLSCHQINTSPISSAGRVFISHC